MASEAVSAGQTVLAHAALAVAVSDTYRCVMKGAERHTFMTPDRVDVTCSAGRRPARAAFASARSRS